MRQSDLSLVARQAPEARCSGALGHSFGHPAGLGHGCCPAADIDWINFGLGNAVSRVDEALEPAKS